MKIPADIRVLDNQDLMVLNERYNGDPDPRKVYETSTDIYNPLAATNILYYGT